VECLSNDDLDGDGVDNDQCMSIGNTCGAKGFPNRYARCDDPSEDDDGIITYTCSICGGCNFNSDCTGTYCCPNEGPLITGNSGPGNTADGQCYTGVYTEPQYLCSR
jgi:hypothetical protein